MASGRDILSGNYFAATRDPARGWRAAPSGMGEGLAAMAGMQCGGSHSHWRGRRHYRHDYPEGGRMKRGRPSMAAGLPYAYRRGTHALAYLFGCNWEEGRRKELFLLPSGCVLCALRKKEEGAAAPCVSLAGMGQVTRFQPVWPKYFIIKKKTLKMRKSVREWIILVLFLSLNKIYNHKILV